MLRMGSYGGAEMCIINYAPAEITLWIVHYNINLTSPSGLCHNRQLDILILNAPGQYSSHEWHQIVCMLNLINSYLLLFAFST